MTSKLTMIGAGILTAISAWLPWVTLMGISQNGFMGEYRGNPGIIFVAMGVIIAVMGLLNKKWSAIVAILFSLCVAGLGIKYYGDATSGDAATVGDGVYCMIVAGAAGIVGGIMRIIAKKNVVVA
jgi:peptidoglycan/LPS O-acetylase OafA/YrhL